MIYTCRFIIYISNTNININTNLVSPEYPIESDYDWTKWLETLLIKGLPKVEVSKVRWENAETRRRIRFGWNQFEVNKVQKVRT